MAESSKALEYFKAKNKNMKGSGIKVINTARAPYLLKICFLSRVNGRIT